MYVITISRTFVYNLVFMVGHKYFVFHRKLNVDTVFIVKQILKNDHVSTYSALSPLLYVDGGG